jgi:hypothetical protein
MDSRSPEVNATREPKWGLIVSKNAGSGTVTEKQTTIFIVAPSG